MKKIIKDALILFAITIIAGVVLGAVYEVTKAPIAQQNQLRKERAYKAVFTDAASFQNLSEDELSEMNDAFMAELGENQSNTLDEAVLAYDVEDRMLGYIITVSNGEGYGGEIQMTVGVQVDGTVTGVEILSISETPGLGLKANEEAFKGQFSGVLTDVFVFTKNGAQAENEIDAITSATYTTRSMTNGVNAALAAYRVISENNKGGASNE